MPGSDPDYNHNLVSTFLLKLIKPQLPTNNTKLTSKERLLYIF